MRYEVLKAANIKMAVFWAIIALMLETTGISETSVNFYQITWHNNNSQDSHNQP
jgi:hypothetical protein